MNSLVMGGYVFFKMRVEELKNFIENMGCEYSNRNIMTFIENIDYSQNLNNTQKTKGLKALQSDLKENFIEDLKSLQVFINKSNLVTEKEPLYNEKIQLLKGLNQFKSYVDSNNFTFYDKNGKTHKVFNITYKCEKCPEYLNEINQISKLYLIIISN
jgi:hypothetical protein